MFSGTFRVHVCTGLQSIGRALIQLELLCCFCLTIFCFAELKRAGDQLVEVTSVYDFYGNPKILACH